MSILMRITEHPTSSAARKKSRDRSTQKASKRTVNHDRRCFSFESAVEKASKTERNAEKDLIYFESFFQTRSADLKGATIITLLPFSLIFNGYSVAFLALTALGAERRRCYGKIGFLLIPALGADINILGKNASHRCAHYPCTV